MLGPSIDLSVLQANIYAEIVDSIGVSWDESYGRLVAFKDREGHCSVPVFKVVDGFNLGIWVQNQRHKKSLSAERIQRLDDIGFVWDPLIKKWEKGFSHLKAFKDREEHFRVPRGKVVDGFDLGEWIKTQRSNRESLSADRIQRLDDIGFVWDPFTEQWEEGFSHLKAFKERERNCRVSQGTIFDGFNLGIWVRNQRRNRESLSAERIQRLDDIGFIWDAQENP